MVLEMNTQSKENVSSPVVNESDTCSSESVINGEVKKVPPKPAKRVSFLYSNRDSANKNNIGSEKSDNDNKKLSTERNKPESFIPKSVLKKSNKNGSLNNCDTLVKNSNSGVTSEENNSGKITLQNKDRIINSDDKQKNIVIRTNSVNQLKSEFVKTNSDSSNYNNQSLLQFSKKPNSNDSTDPQSRLSESQSKIAKLQQSLPTKLSEATVQSLKNKYSPSSYGYPKCFSRFPIENRTNNNSSRIPLISKHISSVKSKFETATETNKLENCNNVSKVSSTGHLKIQEKKIFKTELYITPEIDLDRTSIKKDHIDIPKATKSDTSFLNKLASQDIHSLNETKIQKDTKTIETEKNNTGVDTKKEISIDEVDAKNRADFHIKPKRNEIIDKPPAVPEEKIEETNSLLEVNNNTKRFDDRSKSEQEEDIVVVKAKSIFSEEYPKVECTEKVIVEDDDSDTLTFSSDSENSQKRISSVEKLDETEEESIDVVSPEVEMEEGQSKKPTKKRSNSFKKIFGFGSSKDKKKNEESKNKNGIKNKAAQADNIENESSVFDRNAPERHTFSGNTKPYYDHDNIKPGHYNCRPVQDGYQQYQSSPLYSNQQHFESNRLNSSLPVSVRYQFLSPQENKSRERERLNMNTIQYDLYLTQQNAKRLNNSSNPIVNSTRTDEYVCMDSIDKQNRNDLTQPGFINSRAVNKFIDTTSSSSSCTLESDIQNNIYENALSRKLSNDRSSEEFSSTSNSRIPLPRSASSEKKSYIPNEEKFYERPKFSNSPEMFTTTPRRIQDPQLIKPKAIIPINTERSLPNPYRNNQEESVVNDNVYGNINKQINNNIPRTVGKENVYGKPVPAVRKNLNINYDNTSKDNRDIEEDLYGTVYDSLSPVSAQLKITKTNVIKTANKNTVRSRSVSPSQRQRNRLVSPTPTNSKSNDSQTKKEIEPIKLKLSPNRERLEPTLKSPIDEKLKFSPVLKKENKKKNDEQIHYSDNNINEELNKKGTPEKTVFPIVDINKRSSEPISPKKLENISVPYPVSPVRSKSLQNTNKLIENNPDVKQDVELRLAHVRSPITIRTESPISIASSQSMNSTPKSKLLISSEDLKDLRNTEVYFWEQTNKLTNTSIEKIDESKDNSPQNSPQQVLTQVVVHQQPPVSPRKSDVSSGTPKAASPQKNLNMKNLEAFYWQEIKKLKEKEEHEIYNQNVQLLGRSNVVPEPVVQHRSRSMSPAVGRLKDKRSLSLPRDIQPQRLTNEMYDYTKQSEVIMEERNLQIRPPTHYGVVRHSLPTQNPNFVRGSPQRSTIGPSIPAKPDLSDAIYENYFPGVELRHQAKSSAYAPIFKRGSLVTSSLRESSPQNNKKVSFSNARNDNVQVWPTKNGFTQSPPTRRVEKKNDSLDEKILYSNQNISVTAENERNSQQQQNLPKAVQESPYGTTQQYHVNRNGIVAQDLSGSDQVYKINVQNYQNAQQIPNESRRTRSHSVEPIYISSKPPQYPSNPEQIYGRTKQVTINNKVCDFYGQIHEAPSNIYGNIQKSGVIYGQLQQNPIPGSPKSPPNQFVNKSDFVRGTRLTASFNDIKFEAPRRPLPPIPRDKMMLHGRIIPVVSESESGSEAGEVQRILERREMNRRQIEAIMLIRWKKDKDKDKSDKPSGQKTSSSGSKKKRKFGRDGEYYEKLHQHKRVDFV